MARRQFVVFADVDIQCLSFTAKDDFVKAIGFASYADYLTSDLWAWIRNSLMQSEAASYCRVCESATGLCWHHRDYSIAILAGNFTSSSDVVVRLCNDCHKAIHVEESNFINDLRIVDLRLDELGARFSEHRNASRTKLPTSVSFYFDVLTEFASTGGF